MQNAANKLALFLKFSPAYKDIMKKADAFSRSCKNQEIVKKFIKESKASRGACFIASAAFANTPEAVSNGAGGCAWATIGNPGPFDDGAEWFSCCHGQADLDGTLNIM